MDSREVADYRMMQEKTFELMALMDKLVCLMRDGAVGKYDAVDLQNISFQDLGVLKAAK